MRKLTPILAAVVVAAVPTLTASLTASPAHAKPPKPRAELVTKKVSGLIAANRVTAGATVKNKGNKKAGASVATFYLSSDKRQSGDDTALGTASVGKVKPKKSKPVSGVFDVPSSLAPGAYHVLVCADSGHSVKERKEANNCKGSSNTVQVGTSTGPGGSGPVTVSAVAGMGGTVSAGDVTGGSCASTTCTFPTSGQGTVTFTPAADAGYRFGAWMGATCTGYTSGSDGKITFSNPAADKACTATFVKTLTISFAGPPLGVTGTVTGSASNGTCTAPDLLTGAGSCVVDAGVGSVTLTANPGVLMKLGGWSAIPPNACDGAPAGNAMVFLAPATDKGCSASFVPDLGI
jgi:hypothetical protein